MIVSYTVSDVINFCFVVIAYLVNQKCLHKYALWKFKVTVVILFFNFILLLFGIFLVVKTEISFNDTYKKGDSSILKNLLILFILTRFFTLVMFSKMLFDAKKYMIPLLQS